MPPTRGHDLKRSRIDKHSDSDGMPPTRGHDLKRVRCLLGFPYFWMPPTRGHDLKHRLSERHETPVHRCPPHGGTT